jgi:CheY-like chemotaxis protein
MQRPVGQVRLEVLAFRDVEAGPEDMSDVAGVVEHWTATALQPAHLPVRPQHAIVSRVGMTLSHRVLDRAPRELAVLGMNAAQVRRQCRIELIGLDPEDAVHLIGPRDGVGADVPLPAPDPRHLLQLQQATGVVTQGLNELPDRVDIGSRDFVQLLPPSFAKPPDGPSRSTPRCSIVAGVRQSQQIDVSSIAWLVADFVPVRTYPEAVSDLATGRTVLIVDDDQDMRELLHAVLTSAGITVVDEAVDGLDALRTIDDLAPPPVPDVIVLDNTMPGLTGLGVAEQVLQRFPEQRIILFSAFLTPDLIQEAEQLGVSACASKTDLARLPRLIEDLAARD